MRRDKKKIDENKIKLFLTAKVIKYNMGTFVTTEELSQYHKHSVTSGQFVTDTKYPDPYVTRFQARRKVL